MLNRLSQFPESFRGLIGLTSLTIIIFFIFLILNIFFGPDKDAELKIAEQKKVEQTVVQGDQITKTEIKDSVLNRSSIGGEKSSKAEEIKEIKDLLDSGAIDDDEFKQMKKEILGK